jgi:hypothetical protein
MRFASHGKISYQIVAECKRKEHGALGKRLRVCRGRRGRVHIFRQSDIVRVISCLTPLNISVPMTFRLLHRSFTARFDILFVLSASTEQRCTSDGVIVCYAALCAAMQQAPLSSRGLRVLQCVAEILRHILQIRGSDSGCDLWVRSSIRFWVRQSGRDLRSWVGQILRTRRIHKSSLVRCDAAQSRALSVRSSFAALCVVLCSALFSSAVCGQCSASLRASS